MIGSVKELEELATKGAAAQREVDAIIAGTKKPSRNPSGRPAARYKVRHTSTNGGLVTSMVTNSWAEAEAWLDYYESLDNGHTEIELRQSGLTLQVV